MSTRRMARRSIAAPSRSSAREADLARFSRVGGARRRARSFMPAAWSMSRAISSSRTARQRRRGGAASRRADLLRRAHGGRRRDARAACRRTMRSSARLHDPRTSRDWRKARHDAHRRGAGAVAPRLDGAVVAIGNAPTALFRLLEMIAAGAPRPAAILGMPVGFVGAAESKEALLESGLARDRRAWPQGRQRDGGRRRQRARERKE